MLNTVIRLRRDNDYNYAKIKDRFIPANGELCLVDTAKDGLRIVCGDGKTTFGNLEYAFEVLVQGYYSDNKFYREPELIDDIPGQINKLYIDKTSNQNNIYYFDGISFCNIASGSGGSLPTATAEMPGVMKLYSTIGDNVDGTMTQKAITEELDDKVEIQLNKDEELLIFTY